MEHRHELHQDRAKNIRVAFFLNFIFTILEVIGGAWINSMAIMSDALHDLGDSLSLGLSWYLEKYSQKEPDQKYSFGYARFSLLGALTSSLILVGGSVIILMRAIPRITNPEPVNSLGMFIFAIFGVIVNGLAAWRLLKGSSLHEKTVSWHLLEDVLGWLAILAVSIILLFVNIPVIDPILSVLITFYIVYHIIGNIKTILGIFLQGVPKELSIEAIEKEITEKAGIKSMHHTHLWSLEGEKNLLSTHVVVDDDMTTSDIILLKYYIKELLREKGISHITIEIEYASEDCDNMVCK